VTGSLVFLTPLGTAVAAAAALVLAASLLALRRVDAVRAALRLEAPPRRREWTLAASLAAVPVLLALVAGQPALRTNAERRVRTDAQVYVVIDTSRSMLASAGRAAPTRLDRAKAAAIAIRAALPGFEAGAGTLTDRVLPNLLPSPNERSFDSTVREAIAIEEPPPASQGVTATTLAALAQVPGSGTFAPAARRRALVVLTDGESRPFDPGAVAAALARAPSTALVLVHVWGADEAIYGADGTRETAYSPDPRSAGTLASLAAASGGTVVGEHRAAAAARAVRKALGTGPTVRVGVEPRTRPLGRYVALATLLPLALVLWRRNLR
jgi:hypothetical protein